MATDQGTGQENSESVIVSGTVEGKHLFDTGDGYWMTYDDWSILAKEREGMKEAINDLEIQAAELKGQLQKAQAKIAIQKETIVQERKQTKIIIDAKNDVITSLERQAKINIDKIELLEKNSRLKDVQIANWQEMYHNKNPDTGEKLKWGVRGAEVGAILGIIAGIYAGNSL